MKYYGEHTKQLYNTEKECMDAEFKAKEKENIEKIRKEREAAEAKAKKEQEAAERKAAAEKVEAARKAMVDAQKAYKEELDKFINAYGSFHMSWNSNDVKSIEDLLSTFDVFNLFI